jgi:hypothetical protein
VLPTVPPHERTQKTPAGVLLVRLQNGGIPDPGGIGPGRLAAHRQSALKVKQADVRAADVNAARYEISWNPDHFDAN